MFVVHLMEITMKTKNPKSKKPALDELIFGALSQLQIPVVMTEPSLKVG